MKLQRIQIRWAVPLLGALLLLEGLAAQPAPAPVKAPPAARDEKGVAPADRLPPAMLERLRAQELQRLLSMAEKLEQLRKDYEKLQETRAVTMESLTKAREGFAPEQTDPATVLRRQTINRLLSKMHEVVEQEQAMAREGAATLTLIESNHERLAEIIQNRPDPIKPANPATEAEIKRWLKAFQYLNDKEPQRFASALLGGKLGPLAQELRAEGSGGAAGAGPPWRTPAAENWRLRLDQRMEQFSQMDARIKTLEKTVARQQKELERLQRLVEPQPRPAAPDDTVTSPPLPAQPAE